MKKTIVISLFTLCVFALKASAQTSNDTTAVFSIADSASYTGKYKFEGLPFEFMEVYVKDGKLSFTAGQFQGILDAVKEKKDAFYTSGDALFTFVRNKENKVAEMKIDYQGRTLQGNRQ